MDNQPAVQPVPQPAQPTPGKGYAKRPMWQWILIYLIVGGIVYYGIYYFAYANKGNDSANGNQNSSSLY